MSVGLYDFIQASGKRYLMLHIYVETWPVRKATASNDVAMGTIYLQACTKAYKDEDKANCVHLV